MHTSCLAKPRLVPVLTACLISLSAFCAWPRVAAAAPVGVALLSGTGSAEPGAPGKKEEPAAAPRGPHPFTFDDLARIARISALDVSPDGTQIAFVRDTADPERNRMTSALFVVSTAGGPARQLTFPPAPAAGPGKEAVRDTSPRFSPEGRRLAFISNRDGSQQAFVLDLGGGEARQVSRLPGGAWGPVWTPDGKALVVASSVFPECPPLPQGDECNRRRQEGLEHGPIRARVIERLFYRHWDAWSDGRRGHLMRVGLDGGGQQVADLTPGERDAPAVARAGAGPYAISPDGQELALVENRDRDLAVSTNNDIFVQELGPGGRKLRNLTEDNRGTDVEPSYSPDGQYLAYVSQKRAGYEADRRVLWVYDRRGRARRALTEGLDANVASAAWSLDSKRLYFTTYLAGHSHVYSVAVEGSAQPVDVAASGADDLRVVPGPGGGALVFRCATLSRPDEICRLPLEPGGKAAGPAVVVTHLNDELFQSAQVGKVTDLMTTTKEGWPLHSYLVTPPGFDPGKRYPAVVLIHGGPEGAWEDGWHYRWNPQIYAGAGYVVLMPNPRGSDGFGQKFVEAVAGDWGGGAYDDVMRAADALAALPYVNPKRVGALGASFGGYMVDWIAGHTQRFAALVSHDGVYDLPSMQGETEELWFPQWEFHGEPWNSEDYQKWNPSRFAGNFKSPMLVITNERDFRVPVGQGMQLFTALQRRGVPSKMLIFPDENHWVLKPGNSRLWYATVLDWLHRYLGGAPADRRALATAGTYIK